MIAPRIRAALLVCVFALALAACSAGGSSSPTPTLPADPDFTATTASALKQAQAGISNPQLTRITINVQDGSRSYIYKFQGDNANFMAVYFESRKNWMSNPEDKAATETVINPQAIAVGPVLIESQLTETLGEKCADHYTAELRDDSRWAIVTACDEPRLMTIDSATGAAKVLQ